MYFITAAACSLSFSSFIKWFWNAKKSISQNLLHQPWSTLQASQVLLDWIPAICWQELRTQTQAQAFLSPLLSLLLPVHAVVLYILSEDPSENTEHALSETATPNAPKYPHLQKGGSFIRPAKISSVADSGRETGRKGMQFLIRPASNREKRGHQRVSNSREYLNLYTTIRQSLCSCAWERIHSNYNCKEVLNPLLKGTFIWEKSWHSHSCLLAQLWLKSSTEDCQYLCDSHFIQRARTTSQNVLDHPEHKTATALISPNCFSVE